MNKNGSNAVVSSYHYQLRADGKRSSVTDASGITNYTYDDQGKLTQEAGPYATIAYTYDNVGNRLTRTVTGSTTALLPNGATTTAYDANDRIIGHTYDANGSETTVNGQVATYDFESHLVSLGSVAGYVYDADGNRYSVASAGTTTSYVVDTSLPYASVVEEYNNGSLAARYDYGDDLVRMDRGSGVYYYLYDGLGSTRQLISTAGAVTDSWGYSAFGELASHTGSAVNPFLFNAQQFDGASGNYYLRARYYDQSVGRFISQDPYSGSNSDPASLHRYNYAANNPVSYIDPSGKSLAELSITLAIITVSLGAFYGYDHVGLNHAAGAQGHQYPDVTAELAATVRRIRGAARDHPDWATTGGNTLINPDLAYDAWDIDQLTNKETPGDSWITGASRPSLAQDDVQNRMVIVDGQTFHSYTINYLIFGAMMEASGQSRATMELAVDAAKLGPRPKWDQWPLGHDEVGAMEWAEAGYDGWPDGGSTPFSLILSQGSSGFHTPSFSVHWSGFGPSSNHYYNIPPGYPGVPVQDQGVEQPNRH